MKMCPRCAKSYGVYTIDSEDAIDNFNFCPVCGYEFEKVQVNVNFYDKVHRYINCIVEVLENSTTGDTSVGWYETEDTEEIFDWEN